MDRAIYPVYLSWQERGLPGLRGCSLRQTAKKNQNASPHRDYALNTLNQLEVDLVKFVSKVRNLKVTMTTGNSSLKFQNLEIPEDPQNNVTIYEIWGEETYEWMDSGVEVGERKLSIGELYAN